MYYLDSCICVDLMRGKLPYAYDLMRKSEPALFKIPAIVAAELFYGVQHSSQVEKNRLILERFLQPFEIVDFDEASARVYGMIRNELQQSGLTIGPNDLLIAAMAIAHQAVLVSNNSKEFKRIRSLTFESWYEMEL